MLERIAAWRAELDGLEEQLVKQLSEVRAERDELAVAERVLQRMNRGWLSPRCRLGVLRPAASSKLPAIVDEDDLVAENGGL